MAAVLPFPLHDHETAATLDTMAPAERRRSLGDYLSQVDFIIDTIESLDADDLTGDARNELSEMLIAELAGTRAKVDNVSAALATWESLEAGAAREIERLEARKTRFARLRTRLEDYTLAVLEASKLPKIEGNFSTLKIRRNPPSVVVDDASQVPQEFLRYPPPPPPAPDKTAIGRALKGHQEVPGCRLIQINRLVRE